MTGVERHLTPSHKWPIPTVWPSVLLGEVSHASFSLAASSAKQHKRPPQQKVPPSIVGCWESQHCGTDLWGKTHC